MSVSSTDDDSGEMDAALAEALDSYLTAMQAGDQAACQAIVAQHPELQAFVGSLHALDGMQSDLLEQNAPPILEVALVDITQAETLALHSSEPVPIAPVPGSAVTASSDSTMGERRWFGRYELLEELGRGGMGVVFRARQADLDRIVAVKMILVNRLASQDQVRRFYQEARAAGRLSHPHIVAIHEVGEILGQPFFSMDCIEGTNLADRLAQGPAIKVDSVISLGSAVRSASKSRNVVADTTPPTSTAQDAPLELDAAVRIIRDVARALEYLHANGIVHRDIKPSNILLSPTGVPYLTDFGLAKCRVEAEGHTSSGAIVGTPLYMSPEQAAGRLNDISPRSDIYSLGVILYQALTGQPPHHGENAMRILMSVMEDEPELPRSLNSETPRELEAICLKCLEKNPANRYGSATELAEDLERFLHGDPVLAQTSGTIHRLRRWTRREAALASRWAALACGSLILVAGVQSGDVGWPKFEQIQLLIGFWGCAAYVFQQLVRHNEDALLTRYAWLATDAVLITRLLFIAGHPVGPLLVAYPLLISMSGLFVIEGLVYFMTTVSLISYATLVWLVPEEAESPHYCLIFAAVLIVMGLVTAYQVHRLRTLSRRVE